MNNNRMIGKAVDETTGFTGSETFIVKEGELFDIADETVVLTRLFANSQHARTLIDRKFYRSIPNYCPQVSEIHRKRMSIVFHVAG
jgi:hypothetical protein